MSIPDSEIRDRLKDIDVDEDVDVDSYEADFIENVVYKRPFRILTGPQVRKALEILDKYED